MFNYSSVYSIDMIRLSVMVEKKRMEAFRTQYMNDNPLVNYYSKNSFNDYRHNFSIYEANFHDGSDTRIKNEKNHFWLGFQHYAENFDAGVAELAIEFNPNKCADDKGFLYLILSHFYYRSGSIGVKSCDICRDFEGIDIDTIAYEKNRKNHEIIYNTPKGRSRYLGKRRGHGTVKIYDKAAELKKSDYVCTRWEVTLRFKELYMRDFLTDEVTVENLKVNLPTVHFGDNGFADCKDMKLKCAVHAIKSDFAKLANFSTHMQEKIKPYLEKSALFTISNADLPQIIQSFREYLKSYVACVKPDEEAQASITRLMDNLELERDLLWEANIKKIEIELEEIHYLVAGNIQFDELLKKFPNWDENELSKIFKSVE